MKRHASRESGFLAGLLIVIFLGGCMTVRQEFDGYDRSQVWGAMTAVAESPTYDDWHVLTNEVWHAPDEARMEVYRELQRTIRQPPHKSRIERREWRFRIEMLETDPPMARVVSRGWGVPAHARIEANRYFGDVWQMLGQRPERQPVPQPQEEPDEDVAPE
jgi:hypothetical protein